MEKVSVRWQVQTHQDTQTEEALPRPQPKLTKTHKWRRPCPGPAGPCPRKNPVSVHTRRTAQHSTPCCGGCTLGLKRVLST